MPNNLSSRILWIGMSDGPGSRLCQALAPLGCEVERLADVRASRDALRSRCYSIALVDFDLTGPEGLELILLIRQEQLPTVAVVLSSNLDREIAKRTIREGAADYLTKPIDLNRLRQVVGREIDAHRSMFELEKARASIDRQHRFHDLISRAPRMLEVFETIKRVAPLGSTVLISGETGTGKELVARAIHVGDSRRGPFVAVNCAALSDGLIENELFGHEAGAYTGADRRTKGRFELAHGGTLFLDEVGELSPAVQAKLLRVLQSSRFERVGGTESIHVDIRLVAASNRNLEHEVKAGRFRADLFYRLRVIQLELPPLRERTEDIPLLASHFLFKAQSSRARVVTGITEQAMEALLAYPWPGNVRELENAMLSASAWADGPRLRKEDLPHSIVPRDDSPSNSAALVDIDRPLPELAGELLEHVERDYFTQVLGRYRGNVARTALHSGLSRRSVTEKLRKYGIDRRKFKGSRRMMQGDS